MTCEFCNSTSFVSHQAREMMHGFRDEFVYLECNSCGCLRIGSVPENIAKYYPSDSYYSYRTAKDLRTRLRRTHLRLALSDAPLCGLLSSIVTSQVLDWVKLFGLERGMKILDVGSGGGAFVRDLRSAGFKGVLGLDPFIERDIYYGSGLAIKKEYFSQIAGEWDRIMFHHSLEHIADQIGTLECVGMNLSVNGQCVVRIPISSWAWQNYRTDWVQLDPPRHFCVHTEKSFGLAAAKAGLKVAKIIYDSTAFQFWGSELYKRNIPLLSGQERLTEYFSREEMRDFGQRAADFNGRKIGDQAIFVLERNQ